jgi:hypothetical protein
MKHQTHLSICLGLVLSLVLGAVAQAQWLSHTLLVNNPPTLQQTSAFFPNAPAGYGGLVSVTATNFVDGTGDGYGGIAPTSYTTLSTTFTSLFPTNAGGSFDYLSVGSTDTGDTFDVKFDFNGLANRYLPAGAVMAFLDVDSLENVSNLRAYDANGNQITTAWLQPLASPRDLFDYAAGNSLTPGAQATYSQVGGVYNFHGTATNDTSAFQGFATQSNISYFTFSYDHNQAIFANAPGGYGIAIGFPVPEPATTSLVFAGAAAGLIAGWRKLRRNGRPRSPMSLISTGPSPFHQEN